MRIDILKIYKSLHTWTGIIAGMALFIAFYAGALTMFKQPIERWATPPQQQLPMVEPAQLDALVSQIQANHLAAQKAFTLHFGEHENTTAPISWQQDGSLWQATLNTQQQLQAQAVAPTEVAELIDLLHQTAGIPGGTGHDRVGIYLMGVISVLYALALVSGLIVLLPTLVKDFWALRIGKNLKRLWLDAHNIVGITSLPFHIIISLSAIVFAFHDQFYDSLEQMVYREQPMFSRSKPAPLPENKQLMPVTQLLANIKQLAPDFQVADMEYFNLDKPNAMIRVAGMNERFMVRGPDYGYLLMNPYTGEITNHSLTPGRQDSWSEIITAFFALHFGNYGGPALRWVYFVLGLGGAFLFYSGNLLWVESRRKKQKRNQPTVSQPRNTRYLAAATVGVCLGCIAGVNVGLACSKLLYSLVDELHSWHYLCYYSVFLGCIGWAFYRGAAVAASQLLTLCSATALLIPASSLLTHVLGYGWLHISAATLAVDIMALLAAAGFFLLAKRSRQRALNGPGDSVWSAIDPKTH